MLNYKSLGIIDLSYFIVLANHLEICFRDFSRTKMKKVPGLK